MLGPKHFSCDSNSLNPYKVGAVIHYLAFRRKGKDARSKGLLLKKCTPRQLSRPSWAQGNTWVIQHFCLLQISIKLSLENSSYTRAPCSLTRYRVSTSAHTPSLCFSIVPWKLRSKKWSTYYSRWFLVTLKLHLCVFHCTSQKLWFPTLPSMLTHQL